MCHHREAIRLPSSTTQTNVALIVYPSADKSTGPLRPTLGKLVFGIGMGFCDSDLNGYNMGGASRSIDREIYAIEGHAMACEILDVRGL